MKLLKYIAVGAIALGLTNCESVVDDLNVSPNAFQETSTALLISQGVLNMASIGESEPARIAGMWSGQFEGTDRQYISQDAYSVSDADFDATWTDLYQRGLTQVLLAEQQAIEEGATPREGVAEILQAYYGAEAALLFGDVPFSEVANPDISDPAYEGQEGVIRAAIALLESGKAKAGDFAFTASNISPNLGNIVSTSSTWGQFADALRARYFLSLREYDSALQAAQEAGFSASSNSIDIIHTTVNFTENLFFQFEVEQRTDYLSYGPGTNIFGSVLDNNSFLINLLKDQPNNGAVDTMGIELRFNVEDGDTTSIDTFEINEPLLVRADAKTNDANRLAYYSYTANGLLRLNTNSGGLFAADQNFPIVSFAEVQLIIAECAARDGDFATAVAALNNVRNFWNGVLRSNDYQDYLVTDFNGDDGMVDGDALMLQIMQEKFISVIGLPTFYDVIRTENMIGTNLDGRDTPAQRFLYPAVERSSNSSFPADTPTLDDPTPINR